MNNNYKNKRFSKKISDILKIRECLIISVYIIAK